MRSIICLSGLVLVSLTTAAQAEVILGLEYRQGVGGNDRTVTASLSVANFSDRVWIVPQIGESDLGKTYVASADTVGDYATLDWDSISTQLLGSSDNFNTFYARTAPAEHEFSFQTATMVEQGNLRGDFDTFFAPPDMYFASIDRIELNVTSLVYSFNTLIGGIITWRIYGEPTSVPEPAAAMLALFGLTALIRVRR